jgi:dienelactone hydrolase
VAETPIDRGLAVIELARAGRFDEIRERFPATIQPLVNVESLQAAWTTAIDGIGGIGSVGAPVGEDAPGGSVVKVPLHGEGGSLTVAIGLTATGELTGLQLLPPEAAGAIPDWTPPSYADPSTFDEHAITVGPDPFTVPGTLSLPHGPGPFPAVVLLAGSGPLDRDETVGPNKTFRDLAWGLATRGIVVLRFDKVTYARRAEILDKADFTLNDEYLPQALGAIDLLSHHPAVAADRIFLAGHSLGGTVAPRVAAAAPDVAGLVILGGGAAPLHWVIVRQMRYIASLDPATKASAQSGIDALVRAAERVDSTDLSPATPAAELPFGTPAPYWLDLRAYDAPSAAAGLGKPILIVQGGRDYQSSVDDDLPRWEAALTGRQDVTIRVFPDLNHFFFAGSGPSTPGEAMTPNQHVDPEVIGEIVSWVETPGTQHTRA